MYLSLLLALPMVAILVSQINELKDVCHNGWDQQEPTGTTRSKNSRV